jgi:hypothetical protein
MCYFTMRSLKKKTIMCAFWFFYLYLISGKIIFWYLDAPILAEYFSFAFHKLAALPFIIAIEGGRQIWVIIENQQHMN